MTRFLEPTKILLDTDPGGDDIFALFWLVSLVKQGLAELVAVTTAEGNVNTTSTFSAACKVLQLVHCEGIPVGKGVAVPHKRFNDASHIHGSDGMGNLSQTLPEVPQRFQDAPWADDLILETLQASPGEITIVAIAPLNNLAAAESKKPGILKLAKEIIIMGGAFQHPGNITPYAEFNIAFNPEAAQIVFNSRQDLIILPLDVTRQLLLTHPLLEQITQPYQNSLLGQFIQALGNFLIDASLSYRETHGERGFLVHDAVTLAYLFYPDILQFRRSQVTVETQGEYTLGQTLWDLRHCAKRGANAWVAVQVDATHLFANLVDDLHSLLQVCTSPLL